MTRETEDGFAGCGIPPAAERKGIAHTEIRADLLVEQVSIEEAVELVEDTLGQVRQFGNPGEHV